MLICIARKAPWTCLKYIRKDIELKFQTIFTKSVHLHLRILVFRANILHCKHEIRKMKYHPKTNKILSESCQHIHPYTPYRSRHTHTHTCAYTQQFHLQCKLGQVFYCTKPREFENDITQTSRWRIILYTAAFLVYQTRLLVYIKYMASSACAKCYPTMIEDEEYRFKEGWCCHLI